MARTHIHSADLGTRRVPRTDQAWQKWVSAGRVRNYIDDDRILDWLEHHGHAEGFLADNELPAFDARTEFAEFLFARGNAFEAAAIKWLTEQVGPANVVVVAVGRGDSRSLQKAEATFDAMVEGVPLIYQAVLRNPENRTYGMPDLLVRSDWIHRLVSETPIDEAASRVSAPDLGDHGWHYRVVDIKFTTLKLNSKATDLRKVHDHHKAQVAIYNLALGRLQGYRPPEAYLLGRKWDYTQRGETHRGERATDRLGVIHLDGTDNEIYDLAARATEWVRQVRLEGASWQVRPTPSRPELWPNAKNTQDYPWSRAKKELLNDFEDLTTLWQVSPRKRQLAHDAGVTRRSDPRITPQLLGMNSGTKADLLQAILDANQSDDDQPVLPAKIANNVDDWQTKPALEFYVDFETVNDIDDDFSRFPDVNSHPMIFMVGCGYEDAQGKWRFEVFVADRLEGPHEAAMIDRWIAWMSDVKNEALGETADLPRIVHWSPAETSFLSTQYNSARNRHAGSDWPLVPWFDFLGQVVKREPITVKGALAFGLKAFAKALHSHGLIETNWEDGPADGLGAMTGAWWCHHEAVRRGCRMIDLDLMQEIRDYNEVDCRVMWEAIRYLRLSHT